MITSILLTVLTSLNWIVRTMGELDPVVLEIFKIICVSAAWAGGLLMYVWVNEQRKLKHARDFAKHMRNWMN